jgi:Cys-tRNA(Pro)/Cys-tRNA(Cys) deacylase
MGKKIVKTNAIRLIEQKKVKHDVIEYTFVEGEHVDGPSVAAKIGYDLEHVYKTLVTTAGPNKFFVFVIPVNDELNLKAAAKVVGEKKIEMIHVKELLPLTGYVRGGCSPVGMKKLFPTVLDSTAQSRDFIIVSAGKIGMQVKLNPIQLADLVNAKFANIIM